MAKKWFSDETKEIIARLYNNGKGKEIKDLGIEYGIAQSTIRYWIVDKEKRAEKNNLKDESNLELDQMKKEIKREKSSKSIYEIWIGSYKRYGAPKIYQELLKSGWIHSLKHILNLMNRERYKIYYS